MSAWPVVAPSDPRIDYEPSIDEWRVEEGYTVRDPISGKRVVVEVGFTAEPSVPRLCWRVIPPHRLGKLGPTTHDRIYRDPKSPFTKDEADRLFLLLMLLEGVKPDTAVAAYYAVRWFGHRAWEAARV